MREGSNGGRKPYDPTDYPGEYTGGTPTAPYRPETVGLTQEQDFSVWELRRKRQQEWSRTVGKARQLRGAAEQGLPAQGFEIDPMRPSPGGKYPVVVRPDVLNRQRLADAAALEQEWDSGQQRLPINHPVLIQVLDDARKAGIQLTPNDIRNMTNLGVLDLAANAYNKELQRENMRGAANVLATMRESNPQMAALLPIYAEQKFKETAQAVVSDPNIVENAISAVGSWAMTDSRSPLYWAVKEWEWAQHGIRAAQWNANQQDQASPEFAWRHLFYGVASPDAWNATTPGAGAYDSRQLLATQQRHGVGDDIIDLAVRIAEGVNNASPDAIIDVLNDPASTEEQVRFATDILTGNSKLSAFDAQGLIDDVRFADQSNIGRMMVGKYGESLPTSTKYAVSDATSFGVGFLDPLMFVGAPVRMVTASRYAITKLAPGLARADYAAALGSRRVAGVETNRARRYFEGLLRDLDGLDDMAPGTTQASVARQRIVENYDLLPEDIIWAIADEKNVSKVEIGGKTARTMDGVVTKDGRVAEGFIDFLTNENEKWLNSGGKASIRAQRAGESYLIQKATAGKIMDGLDAATALKVARESATPEMLKEAARIRTGALMKDSQEIGKPMAFRMGQRGKRDQVIPYRGIIGDFRRRTVNSVVLATMPTSRTDDLVEAYMAGSLEPEALAQALDQDVVGQIARDDRSITGRGAGSGLNLVADASALADRFTGKFSSMPNSQFINIRTGENAQQVYLYARQFHTRSTAAFIADKFRTADQGTRRRILAGLIRSSAASRGLRLADDELQTMIGDLATGSRRGEMFSIALPDVPSARSLQATLREAGTHGEYLAKEEARLAKAERNLAQAQERAKGAADAGNDVLAAVLTGDVRRLSNKVDKHRSKVARHSAIVDQYKRRLVKALGMQDRLRPSSVAGKLPAETLAEAQARVATAESTPPIVVPAADEVVEASAVQAPDGAASAVAADVDAFEASGIQSQRARERVPRVRALLDEGNVDEARLLLDSAKAAEAFDNPGRLSAELVSGFSPLSRAEQQARMKALADEFPDLANDNFDSPGFGTVEQDDGTFYTAFNDNGLPEGKYAEIEARYAEMFPDEVAPAAPKTFAATEVKLPNDLSGAAPNYRDKKLAFASDLDRALFIVRKSVKRSERDEDYMALLRKQLPALDDDGIRARGDVVSNKIKSLYDDANGTVTVERIYSPGESAPKKRGASAERETQAQQILADNGTLVDAPPSPVEAAPGAPAPQAQQIALDAEGMTPPPQQMTGARMVEMPFGDTPVPAAVDSPFTGTEVPKWTTTYEADATPKWAVDKFGMYRQQVAQETRDGYVYSIETFGGNRPSLTIKVRKVGKANAWNKPSTVGGQKVWDLGMPDASVGWNQDTQEWVKRGRQNNDSAPTQANLDRAIAYANEAMKKYDLRALAEPPVTPLSTNAENLMGRQITDGVVFRGMDENGKARLEIDTNVISEDDAWDEFSQTLADLRVGDAGIEDFPMVDGPAVEPALDPVEEAAQTLTTFDEFFNGHINSRILADWLQPLQGKPYDDETLQIIKDIKNETAMEWAAAVLADPQIRAGFLRHMKLGEEVVPPAYVKKFGKEYDDQIDNSVGEGGFASRSVGGTVDPIVEQPFAKSDNSTNARKWRTDGAISRGVLMDLMDKYGEDGFWAWWNTGNPEAIADPRFFDTFGPTPALRPDPGKGLPAARRAAQVPGEYTGAAIEGGKRGMYVKVPWAGTGDARTAYIADQYEMLADDVIENALQVGEIAELSQYMDMLLIPRNAAEDAALAADEAVGVQAALPVEQAAPTVTAPVEQVMPSVDPAVPAAQDTIEGTVLNRVDEPIPAEPAAAAAPPADPPNPPAGNAADDAVPEPEPAMPSTREIEVWLNRYDSQYASPQQIVDGEMVYSPSRDQMGREHALHMYQTSDFVVLPTMSQIESFGFFGTNPVGRLLHASAQRPTDLWSLGTLYGFRFAQRSAIEDLITYVITGGAGRIGDLARGRRGSTAMREAAVNARVIPRKGPNGKVMKDENGQVLYDILVPKTEGMKAFKSTSRLGMVARWSRKVGDQIQKSNIESVQGFLLPNLDADKVLHAAAEAERKNYAPMRSLIAEAVGRQRFTRLSADDIEALQDLGGTVAGTALMNQIAEGGGQAVSGAFKSLSSAMDSLVDHPEIEWARSGKPVYFGDYKKLALSANDKEDPFATWYWHRSLQAIVRDDGPIGAIFVQLMHEPDRAKKAIADAIRKDTRMGYKERFSLIADDVSIDDFAHRYYEGSLVYFQRQDGSISEYLRSQFIDKWTDPKTGKEKMRVSWTKRDGRDHEFLKVTVQDLGRAKKHQKPMYVLGRGSSDIPMPTTDKALFDRAWDWMGEQYARIGREPIFIGNYLANRRALKAAGMDDRLAQGFADARAGGKPGSTVTATDREMARQVTSRQAMDSAYAFSLNYMDNPNNRSVLAWKVRNLSRYYRATEDFARRAYRIAVNYPDAYVKLALTYQILDDTGWTYRDGDGNLYFAYPMNGLMQDAFALINGLIPGGTPASTGIGADPFVVGGNVKNIAPSTDPTQWLPTIVGPVGTIPLVGLFNLFPQMQGLRTLTLGGYSDAGTTGNMAAEMIDVFVPAGAKRFWSTMSPAERDASLGSSMVGALATMYADGTLDDVLDPNGMLTLEQLKRTDIYGEATKRAFGIQITKMTLGYAAPASPQVYQNNISDAAREMGFEGMNSVFHALVDKNDGDLAAAYVDWQRMDPDGRLTPFTISKTKDNPEMIAGLTKAKPYTETVEWMRDPKVRDLAQRFPDTYMFLGPQLGTFDWSGWALVKANGFRVDKTVDEMMIDMFAAQGEALDRKTIASYDQAIAALDPTTDEGRKQINELESQKSNDRNTIENMNPYWAAKRDNTIDFYSLDRLAPAYVQTQQMLTYIEERDGELTGSAKWIKSAMDTWISAKVAKDGLSPYTDAGKAQRSALESDLAEALAYIGEQDPSALQFIETMLSSQTLFDQLKG